MIPFTSVALALAPSVPTPDAVFVICQSSQLMLRHDSDALLVVWNRVLWDWHDLDRQTMSRWMATLDGGGFLFLQTTLETAMLSDQLGWWTANPFSLRYEGGIRYEPHGQVMRPERMSPHPDRLVRHFEHGRMAITRSLRSRPPETARSTLLASSSGRSHPRLAAVTVSMRLGKT